MTVQVAGQQLQFHFQHQQPKHLPAVRRSLKPSSEKPRGGERAKDRAEDVDRAGNRDRH